LFETLGVREVSLDEKEIAELFQVRLALHYKVVPELAP
jgi:hypothetical protein